MKGEEAGCVATSAECALPGPLRFACDDRLDCVAQFGAGFQCCVVMRDPVSAASNSVRESLCARSCDGADEYTACRPEDGLCPEGTTCLTDDIVDNYGDFRVCK